MKKVNKTEKPKKQTRFGKYNAILKLSEESKDNITAKTKDLKLQSDALVDHFRKRVNSKNMSRKDRIAAVKLVAKQVQPMTSMIKAIYNNLDRPMQEKFKAKFDALFKNDKQFDTALANFMKGKDDKKVSTFLGQITQLVAQQDGSRADQLKAVSEDKTVKKAEKFVKNPLVKLGHKLKPKGMSTAEVVAKKKGEKALVARKGGAVEGGKPKFGFFAKKRQLAAEKETGKKLGKK